MKHAVRISVLMLGLVGTYMAAAVPQVPAPDGGPIITCPPQQQLQQNAAADNYRRCEVAVNRRSDRWPQGHQSNLQ